MADEYKGLTIEFRGKDTQLRSVLSQIVAESRKASGELSRINKALKIDPKSTALMKEAMKAAGDEAKLCREKVDSLKTSMKQLEAENKVDTTEYEKVSRELAIAEAWAKKARSELLNVTETSSNFGQLATKIENASNKINELGDKAKSISGKVKGIGDTLTAAVTLPIVGAAGASVKAAVDIDSAWYGVRKTVDATEEQYQELKDSAIELSKTQPISAETILNIEALGGQLGIVDESTEDLTGTLENFAMIAGGLDIATNLNAEEAATKLAQFKNITKMSNDELSNFASAIVDLGNHSATTESDILEMATRIASAGVSANMSVPDILGLATALSSTGMDAEAGGSAISKTINNISSACANYESALDGTANMTKSQMDRVVWLMEGISEVSGMTVDEFRQAWETDATGALTMFLTKANELGDCGENLNAVFTDLGINEIRQSDALRRMAGNSDLVTSCLERSRTAYEQDVALKNEVEKRNESLASKFEVLKNKVIAVAEDVGGPLADALLNAIDAAEPLFRAIESGAETFNNMTRNEQQTIIKTVALVAAFGPLLSIVGRIGSGFGSLLKGISGVGKGVSGAFRAMSAFRTAMTATNPELIKGAQESGKLASKFGLLFNKNVEAAGGIKSYTKALNTLTTSQGKASGNTTKVSNAMVQSQAAIDKSTGAIGKATSAFDKLAMVGGRLVGALGLIGTVASVGAIIYEVAQEAHKAAIHYDENADAATRAAESMDDWAEAAEGASSTSLSFNMAMDGSGRTVEQLDSIVEKSFANIVAIIQRDMQQAGKLTEDGAKQIEENLARIREAVDTKAQLMATVLSTYSSQFTTVNKDNLKQYLDGLNQSYDEARGELDKFHQDELAAIAAEHQAKGTLNSEAFQQDVEASNQHYQELLGLLDQNKLGQIEKMEEMYEGLDETTKTGLDKLDENVNKWKERAGKIPFYEVNDIKTQFNELRKEVSNGTLGAMMGMAGAVVASGGQIDESTKGVLANFLGCFADLPDELKEGGKESMEGLAASLREAGIDIGDTADMTADEIVTAIAEKLGMGMEVWRESLTQGTQAAVDEAAKVSGKTVEALKADMDKYGIAGNEAIQAYCEALANGNSESIAAGAALSGWTVQGIRSLLDSFGITGDEAIAKFIEHLQSGDDPRKAAEAVSEEVGEGLAQSEGKAAESGEFTKAAFVKSATDPSGIYEAFSGLGATILDCQPIMSDAGETLGWHLVTSMGTATIDNSGEVTKATDQLAYLVGQSLGVIPPDANLKGSQIPSEMASGIDSGAPQVGDASEGLKSEAINPLTGVPDDASKYASDGSSKFAAGLIASKMLAMTNATTMAAQAALMNANAGKAYGWGSDMGANFAAGMRTAVGLVQAAANAIASAAAAALHHSTPEIGPLKDDDVWGLHMAENIAKAMYKGVPQVKRASLALAEAAVIEPPSYQNMWNNQRLQTAMSTPEAQKGPTVVNNNFNAKIVRSDADMNSALRQYFNTGMNVATEVM